MQPKHLRQIFLWPALIGVLTGAGLVIALIDDQWLETLSLGAISLPIAVIFYIYFFANPMRR
jgi:hypothetical protein